MPLPGTRVIPAGWSAHHQPTAEGTFTTTGTITRATGGGTDQPDGSWRPSPPVVIYNGPCRVVRDTADEDHPIVGERRLTTRRYEIQIPVSAPSISVNDVLTITAASDGSSLLGKKFRIESERTASEEWSRNLSATEFEEG